MIEVFEGTEAYCQVIAEIHQSAASDPWSASFLTDLLRKPTVSALVAKIGHTPAGFVLVQQGGDEAEILNIATAPPLRRKGIAKALIVSISKQLTHAGVRALFLEVAADNDAAKALYASLGFEEVGRRVGYYPRETGPMDALLLRRNLVEGTAQTK